MINNIDVVFLGDSLLARAHWDRLFPSKKVLNLGVDGSTTKDVLMRMDKVIELQPKNVVLLVGVNDLNLYTPQEEVYENYMQILEKLKHHGIHVIILPLLYTQMNTLNTKIRIFNQFIYEHVQENEGFECMDLNEIMSEHRVLKECFTTDGLHLNTPAYEVIAKKLSTQIS